MPANRSRTERWRECLWQIYERHGSIEFSVAPPPGADDAHADAGADLVWRSRILALSDHEILVETPVTLGKPVHVAPGVELVCVIAIGQNRWMFRSRTLHTTPKLATGARPDSDVGLRLAMPTTVERCTRRNFLRVSAAQLNLPKLDLWPLLDPASAVLPELAYKAHLESALAGHTAPAPLDTLPMPEVGPLFHARLLNIGGGGAGLLVPRQDAGPLDRHRAFWARLHLAHLLPVPLALTVKLAHTHIDSEQNVYAGVAFDFSANPGHREFVVSRVLKAVEAVQARQLASPADRAQAA